MSTKTGLKAESAAANHLTRRGYEVVDRNWRTRYCEIDLVATKQDCVYLVEVKYRKTSLQGGGLDYITATKLKQMQFAAQFWATVNDWEGDYSLMAVEVFGADYRVEEPVAIT